MKLISNKGNVYGVISEYENTPEYIEKALSSGFDVKIDLTMIDNKLYIGNEIEKHKLDIDWLEKHHNRLWLECKDIKIIERFNQIDNRGAYLNYFWHENDLLTLTSRGYVLSYGVEVVGGSVMMLPEINDDTIKSCYGICSNNIIEYIKYTQ